MDHRHPFEPIVMDIRLNTECYIIQYHVFAVKIGKGKEWFGDQCSRFMVRGSWFHVPDFRCDIFKDTVIVFEIAIDSIIWLFLTPNIY
jgi:hypothetical protein